LEGGSGSPPSEGLPTCDDGLKPIYGLLVFEQFCEGIDAAHAREDATKCVVVEGGAESEDLSRGGFPPNA
jgi:hypothetical protein